jgi:hypothetical protein
MRVTSSFYEYSSLSSLVATVVGNDPDSMTERLKAFAYYISPYASQKLQVSRDFSCLLVPSGPISRLSAHH